MDFRWTKIQDELYDRVLGLTKEKLNSSTKKREFDYSFNSETWHLFRELGIPGLCIPERYGGMNLDVLTTARVIEALGRGCEDMGMVFSVLAHLFACVMPIFEHGTELLKQEMLPKLCSGEWKGANAITEKEAGSDVFALKTKAVRDGDSYVLKGSKNYVTNGPIADAIVIYASTNPAHGYLGVTAFVVKKNTPGLTIRKPFSKMGLNSTPASAIYLEDCRVPESNRLGNEGQGARIFQSSMQWERACLFAAYVGMMDRQLQQAIAYARSRRQFGKAICKNQAISHRIANMKLRLESARLLLYRACWLFDQGKNSVLDVSMSKLAISEAAITSSLDAIQIHGGIGFMTEFGIEQELRDAIPSTIFSGTSEMQRDLIARELGL
jgi:alkylation response protein AidB-like acyl-CoA dehydrogenase